MIKTIWKRKQANREIQYKIKTSEHQNSERKYNRTAPRKNQIKLKKNGQLTRTHMHNFQIN